MARATGGAAHKNPPDRPSASQEHKDSHAPQPANFRTVLCKQRPQVQTQRAGRHEDAKPPALPAFFPILKDRPHAASHVEQGVPDAQQRRVRERPDQGQRHTHACRSQGQDFFPTGVQDVQRRSQGHLQGKRTEIVSQNIVISLRPYQERSKHRKGTDTVHQYMQQGIKRCRTKNRHAGFLLFAYKVHARIRPL